MRTALLALVLLSACETMPSSGNPLAPVQVDVPVAAEAPEAGGEQPSTDARFEKFDDTFSISSEELSGMAPADDGQDAAEGVETGAEVDGGDGVADAAVDPGAEDDPFAAAYDALEQPAAASEAQAVAGQGPTMSGWPGAVGGWPLRLVSTVADAQPPRAILGLPDGREIVVSPGTMVPEAGVVVMAVGRDQVDLARVQAVGDHANVMQQTLTAQF